MAVDDPPGSPDLPEPDGFYDLGELVPLGIGEKAPGKSADPAAIIDDDDEADNAWAGFGSAGGGGGAGGSLDDPILKQRLTRLAPRIALEAALDTVLAKTARRRYQRRAAAVLSVAAVIMAVFLLVKTWPSDHDAQVVASGGSSSTVTSSTRPNLNRGTFSPDELPSSATAGSALPFEGTFVPGSYLPSFPTVPVPSFGTQPATTTTTRVTPLTSATTTPRPPGDVTISVKPATASVVVGDRLMVDLEVVNGTNADIAYVKGSSSCPALGGITAADIANPTIPAGWPGGSFVGQGAQMATQVPAHNRLEPKWQLRTAQALTGVPCTADQTTATIAPGQMASVTFGFDADAPPGTLANGGNLVLNGSFDYWPTVQDAGSAVVATKKTVSKTVNEVWQDNPTRMANLPAVYAAVDANPEVRAFLDVPGASYTVWAGFHRGAWVFGLGQAAGSVNHTVVVDPTTAAITSFT